MDANWAEWEKNDKYGFVGYFGDKDTLLYYGCGVSVKFEGGSNGTPILNVPEYQIDKNSQAYKDYEAAMDEYQTKLDEYAAAQKEYEEKYGKDSPEYKAYLEKMEEYQADLNRYEAAMAEAEAAYEQAMEEYTARKAEIEQKYANDKAAYDAAIKALEEQFKNRTEADVLQPGDVRKFQIFLTSSSKHTYKYKEGSFTLATPEWEKKPGGTTGFDGQILPDEYVDNADYHVTLRCDPIQKLLVDTLGVDSWDAWNGLPGYVDNQVKKYLAETYGQDSVAANLNAYLLDYYNSKDGTSYATIDELVKGNPEARTELTKTETSGNKWFELDGEKFVVDAHLETVQYDTFYKQLLFFAYGDKADIEEILGDLKQMPDGRFEYENDSWTDSGLKKALYYYMAHDEIWKTTDRYFQELLEGGLKADQATWTAFMMALNIDGELTGNDWQDTKWPWYNSIKLEQADGDFKLSKVEMVDKVDENGNVVTDENGNAVQEAQTITDSEAKFQLWTIEDRIINEETQEKVPVKMYCTRDEDGNFYFTEVESILETTKGDLEILYTLMQDTVYYPQAVVALKCDQVHELGTTYDY